MIAGSYLPSLWTLKGLRWCAEGNEQIRSVIKSEVMNMYQIYSLLTIVAILWGIAMWASIPEEIV